MIVAAFLGFVLGYLGSMPVAGPIAVLVFERDLEDRPGDGLYLASGAALAESAYAYLAFWGFSAVLTRYLWVVPTSRAAAALILTGLGLYFLRWRPKSESEAQGQQPSAHKRSSFFLGLTITALNPTLLATWTAAVTTVYSFGLLRFDSSESLPFAGGAFCGIVSWFATLIHLMDHIKQRFSPRSMDRLVHGMGFALIAVGVGIASRFIYQLTTHT
jgi:threonine/homoserine/homoserine lactone efflux protein